MHFMVRSDHSFYGYFLKRKNVKVRKGDLRISLFVDYVCI